MEDIKLAEKLWDLANIVTGFAVAQVIATTFALANNQIAALTGRAARWIAFVCTVVFTGFYLGAIIWCNHKGADLDPQHTDVCAAVNCGRMVAIVLFTLVLLFAPYGHRDNERKAEKKPIKN